MTEVAEEGRVKPRLDRLMAGFLLAPAVPYVVFPFLLLGFASLYVFTAFVGVLLYGALRNRLAPTPLNAGLAGMVTGLLVWALQTLNGAVVEFLRLTKIRHVAFGDVLWRNFPGDLFPYVLALAFGFIGGVAFWFCVVWRDRGFSVRTGQ